MCPIPIDSNTALYGVIGNPVVHSLSPAMHNRAFAQAGHNGVYLAFCVTDIAAAMAGVRALGMAGISVTLPHKVTIMDHLDAVDDLAEKIGAVNTVVNCNGQLTGFNTDGTGAADALAEAIDITGRQIALIGAGGAARAIGFTLMARGAKVTILNRSAHAGKALSKDLGAAYAPMDQWGRIGCDVVINTTPVGMAPQAEAIPINTDHINPAMVVMDIVYNPRETMLLKTARSLGCKTVDGVAMFVNQGAAQFELWTGKKAPRDIMRVTVLEKLNP